MEANQTTDGSEEERVVGLDDIEETRERFRKQGRTADSTQRNPLGLIPDVLVAGHRLI
jgi:hypothetical protein